MDLAGSVKNEAPVAICGVRAAGNFRTGAKNCSQTMR